MINEADVKVLVTAFTNGLQLREFLLLGSVPNCRQLNFHLEGGLHVVTRLLH